jgi:hypothetical protein
MIVVGMALPEPSLMWRIGAIGLFSFQLGTDTCGKVQ